MSSVNSNVSLNRIAELIKKGDKNGNGKLDRQEMAKLALDLKAEGKTNEYALFATFVLRQELMPDWINGEGRFVGAGQGDGEIGLAEFAKLAAADAGEAGGDAESISAADFKNAFTTAGSGVTIDDSQLESVANGEDEDVSVDESDDVETEDDVESTDDEAQSTPSQNNKALFNQLLQIIMLFLFSMMNQQRAYPPQPQPYAPPQNNNSPFANYRPTPFGL